MADRSIFYGLSISGADGANWTDTGAKPKGDAAFMLLASVVQVSKMYQCLIDLFAFAQAHGGDPSGFAWPLPVSTAIKWRVRSGTPRYYDAPNLSAATLGRLGAGEIVEQLGVEPETGEPQWVQHARGWTAAMLLEKF